MDTDILALFLLIFIPLVSLYPLYLVIRFLQLGCKAFKKYLREKPIYEISDEE